MVRRQPSVPEELKARPFTVAEGRELGMTRRQLDRPGLRQAPYGVRTAGESDLVQRSLAALVAVDRPGRPAVLSHVTAARLWGVPLPRREAPGEPVDVAVRRPGRASRAAGIAGHVLCDDRIGVVHRHGLPVVDAATVLCQLAGILTVPDLVAVGDALVYAPRVREWDDDRPWLTLDELASRVRGFHGRGKRRASAAVRLIRPGAASRPESLLRVLLAQPGWPEPEVNVAIRDRHGRLVAYPDLLYRRWRVVVEYDGDQHRTSRAQYERDVQRLAELDALGFRVVRVLADGLFRRPGDTLARVRWALVQAGWRPSDTGERPAFSSSRRRCTPDGHSGRTSVTTRRSGMGDLGHAATAPRGLR